MNKTALAAEASYSCSSDFELGLGQVMQKAKLEDVLGYLLQCDLRDSVLEIVDDNGSSVGVFLQKEVYLLLESLALLAKKHEKLIENVEDSELNRSGDLENAVSLEEALEQLL